MAGQASRCGAAIRTHSPPSALLASGGCGGRALKWKHMNSDGPPPSAADLELWHRIETEPAGTFRLFRADGVGTEERIQQHLLNFEELSSRIAHAMKSGCVIEIISLRL